MQILILHSYDDSSSSPDEQDTLVQVNAVSAALLQLGHSVTALRYNPATFLENFQKHYGVDCVFNLVESVAGHGRDIYLPAEQLEQLGIPFTGNGAKALKTTTNKVAAKKLMRASGITTPHWYLEDNSANFGNITTPKSWIVKPVDEDASVAINDSSVVTNLDYPALSALLKQRSLSYGGALFAEEYIAGREFNISVLGSVDTPQVLPIAEMIFKDYPQGKPQIVNYAAKWDSSAFEYHHTIRSFSCPQQDKSLLAKLQELSISCWYCFELSGYARVDLRVDQAGIAYVIEVNANPGIAPDAGFVAAANQFGMSYTELIDQILNAASCRASLHRSLYDHLEHKNP